LGCSAIKNFIPTVCTAYGWAFADRVIWWYNIIGIISERIMVKYYSKIICVSENDKQLALKYEIALEEKLQRMKNWEDRYFKAKEKFRSYFK